MLYGKKKVTTGVLTFFIGGVVLLLWCLFIVTRAADDFNFDLSSNNKVKKEDTYTYWFKKNKPDDAIWEYTFVKKTKNF